MRARPSAHQFHVMQRLADGWRLPFPMVRLTKGSERERCSIITALALRNAGWVSMEQKEEWHDPPKGYTREEWGEVYRWQEFVLTDSGRRALASSAPAAESNEGQS